MPIVHKSLVFSNDSESFRYTPDEYAVVPITGHVGSFAHKRKNHIHEGLDIYLPEGTPIFSKGVGTVVDIVDFTGTKVGSAWWNDTQAVVVDHSDYGYVLYGEITPHPSLQERCVVQEGDCIGYVKTVLKKDKGRPMSMLHIESYTDYSEPFIWEDNLSVIPVRCPLFLFDSIAPQQKSVLFVSGYFSRGGGKRSAWCDSLVQKSGESFPSIEFVNGGDLDTLEHWCKHSVNYSKVIWWANVDNSESKATPFDLGLENLIISKNNRDLSYTRDELKRRMDVAGARGLVEFHKDENGIRFRCHPLTVSDWGTDILRLSEYLF